AFAVVVLNRANVAPARPTSMPIVNVTTSPAAALRRRDIGDLPATGTPGTPGTPDPCQEPHPDQHGRDDQQGEIPEPAPSPMKGIPHLRDPHDDPADPTGGRDRPSLDRVVRVALRHEERGLAADADAPHPVGDQPARVGWIAERDDVAD